MIKHCMVFHKLKIETDKHKLIDEHKHREESIKDNSIFNY